MIVDEIIIKLLFIRLSLTNLRLQPYQSLQTFTLSSHFKLHLNLSFRTLTLAHFHYSLQNLLLRASQFKFGLALIQSQLTQSV